MTALVVDASVAIKWFVPEPGSNEAVALLGNRLLAPDLLLAECTNVLWKMVARRELSAEEASLIIPLIAAADVELLPVRALVQRAAELAIKLRHPAYDCFYLAAAQVMDAPFVTADDRLRRKLADTPGFHILPLPEAARMRESRTRPAH